MTDIDQKEIRGMTIKLLRGLILQTVLIVGGACGFYFTLKADIKNNTVLREQGDKYWQLKFTQIEAQNQVLQKQMDGIGIQNQAMQKQLDILDFRINSLKR